MTFSHISCPNCEFQFGTSGAPTILPDNRLSCTDCGTIWKDMNAPRTSQPNTLTILPAGIARVSNENQLEKLNAIETGNIFKFAQNHKNDRATSLNHNFGAQSYQTPISRGESKSFANAAVASFGLVFAVTVGVIVHSIANGSNLGIDPLVVASIPANGLQTSNIKFESRSKNGDTAGRVTGEITNTSSGVLNLPNYHIILLGKDNEEVYRWRYKATAKRLEPTGKIKFSTSMAGIPGNAKSARLEPVRRINKSANR